MCPVLKVYRDIATEIKNKVIHISILNVKSKGKQISDKLVMCQNHINLQ
jgi:hypothetical protein